MHYRIFSKLHNLYTGSRFWSSNQRSFSEWAIDPSGEVIEIIYFSKDFSTIQKHNRQNFEIEAWTGYFDRHGKKIYRGDILGSFKGIYDEIDPSYETEVVWHEGGFYCKEEQTVPDYLMPLDIENKVWKRHFIKGNIHGVDYSDV